MGISLNPHYQNANDKLTCAFLPACFSAGEKASSGAPC